MPVPEISPEELAAKLNDAAAARPVLLDVRTHGEHQLVAFPGSVLIPLHELAEREDEWQGFGDREVVVYCHHGIRSLSAAAWLESHGVRAVSLRGGIDLYARRLDPSLPRY